LSKGGGGGLFAGAGGEKKKRGPLPHIGKILVLVKEKGGGLTIS